jgi:hypothetical protein
MAKALLPEAKMVLYKTRIVRPLIKDSMEWREIQGLVNKLLDR